MKENSLKTKAFTLIELLVVVAIISLLSSVVIASVSDAREKAAITKLKEEVKQIQTALEMYRIDNNEYPDAVSSNYGLSHILNNELSSYINLPNLSTKNIRSFDFTKDGNEEFFYMKNTNSNDDFFSCGNASFTPYVIFFMSDQTGLDFKSLNYNSSGQIISLETEYCISTQI